MLISIIHTIDFFNTGQIYNVGRNKPTTVMELLCISWFILTLNLFLGRDLALAIALVSWWVCVAMACAKCAGTSKENLFKKARGRLYFFLTCPKFHFFKVQVFTDPLTCQHGKSFLKRCQSFCLETNLSRPYGWQRVCIGCGGLLKRQSVPRGGTKLRKLFLIATPYPAIYDTSCCGM